MLKKQEPNECQSECIRIAVRVMGDNDNTNALQVTMNNFVSMQVFQTTDDAK